MGRGENQPLHNCNEFPRLRRGNYRVTSCRTRRYNCIAWAAGREDRWWWPGSARSSYWPPGVPRECSLGAFALAFGGLGYEECRDGSLEVGFQKIALFAKLDNQPTHAARQLANGKWTSKLGPLEDIMHDSVEDVSGPEYGDPVMFMRRACAA